MGRRKRETVFRRGFWIFNMEKETMLYVLKLYILFILPIVFLSDVLARSEVKKAAYDGGAGSGETRD